MADIERYVAYYIVMNQSSAQTKTESIIIEDSEESSQRYIDAQQAEINEYISARQPYATIVSSFEETPESKKASKWPKLEQALQTCKEQNATLLIAQLGTLFYNESFTKLILEANVNLYFCDQPYIKDKNVLEVLYKSAQTQRKLHGQRIREGLKLTSAKSGNPNAAEVIGKVNKPKIDTAIIFAFLLTHIITDYKKKGYSQRQMVKALNEEGFTAPEGGKWVLSQLQKVLDRVKLNDLAKEIAPILREEENQFLTNAQIVELLTQRSIAPFKKKSWDESQVNKVIERINQIEDIEFINDFVLNVLPIIHEFKSQGLNEKEIVEKIRSNSIKVNNTEVTTS